MKPKHQNDENHEKKQVNVLQSCSFLCLALAAWSFASQGVWLSRMALALPFCVSLVQCLQPDGPENLAERLRQERGVDGDWMVMNLAE